MLRKLLKDGVFHFAPVFFAIGKEVGRSSEHDPVDSVISNFSDLHGDKGARKWYRPQLLLEDPRLSADRQNEIVSENFQRHLGSAGADVSVRRAAGIQSEGQPYRELRKRSSCRRPWMASLPLRPSPKWLLFGASGPFVAHRAKFPVAGAA